MNKKTIIFVFGTRPELIKVYPLIREAKKHNNINVIACSTGQHKDMLESLYKVLEFIPDVDFSLMKPNQSLTLLHAETMLHMQKLIKEVKPNWVVVQGDTSSAHAAAMAAFYERVPVAHVEAGLRTYDINSPYPEEMNRRAIGLIARAHFCPTQDAADNLKSEGVDSSAYSEVTGNTGIDTLKIISNKIENSEDLKKQISKKFSYLNLNNFILATMHRRENFGEPQRQILHAFCQVAQDNNVDFIFPVHPNPNVRIAVEQIYSSKIGKDVFWVRSGVNSEKLFTTNKTNSGRVFLIEPLDYLDMVFILKQARLIMTDSGGLQDEAPAFAKKILVLRNSTERPEGIEAGFAELVGTDFNKIVTAANRLLKIDNHWPLTVPPNPFGDGFSAHRIINSLMGDH